MKKITFLFASLLVTMNTLAGDKLTLLNQMVFEGKVTKIKGCSVIFKVDNAKHTIPVVDIFSIEFENANDRVYTDYMATLNPSNPDACLNGQMDAKNFHGKKVGHVLLGFLFGPFAMIGTALANPNPYNGRETLMLSPNKDQFTDPVYLKCYKKKAKGQLLGMEAIGWAVWIVIAIGAS